MPVLTHPVLSDRSLQVYGQLGRPHSHLLSDQQETDGGSPLGGPLRFPNVCIFWLQCELDGELSFSLKTIDLTLDGQWRGPD